MHEVEFCAQVKSWLDALFASHPEWPFDHAAIEQYGSGSTKRSDLRIYAKNSTTPILTGEVKMPGTEDGHTPFRSALMKDAEAKADSVQCQYFFTWNVQTFVLFDRSLWKLPLIQRRIKHWIIKPSVRDRYDCARPDVSAWLSDKFLPEIFTFFATIIQGKITNWGEPADAIFITSLEGHLSWPVNVTTKWLETETLTDKPLKTRLQAWMAQEMGWSFDPDDAVDWHAALDRAARTLCYVFSNQIIFYEALRAKYPDRLTALHMPKTSRDGAIGILKYFGGAFQNAVRESGDYESIFAPHLNDWAASLIFAAPETAMAWAAFLANLAEYDFRTIPFDVVGGIFQRLISPEERQRFGQFFTHEDVIDVINAFCIRRAGDTVLDPSCGSGSFLVRAYHRKAWLSVHRHGGGRHQDHDLGHSEILREIFGCDISHFAAHLATLNLAARHIEDEENYPCIARRNFFDVPRTPEAFCELPGGLRDSHGRRRRLPVPLPKLDAIVGNPPYIRQEKIPKLATVKREPGEPKAAYEARRRETKEYLLDTCRGYWPGVKLSGRSDLHCYFWPVAAGLLKDNGWFGFLTSSSWLDVEYGFDLQRWILENFKLVAVMESLDEPWFSDARIKTAVTILQRCNNQKEREANTVRFVRLLKPLRDILGLEKTNDEGARQQAAERLRDLILKTGQVVANDHVRIVPVPQRQLWEEGVRAAELLRRQPAAAAEEDDADETTGIADSATTDYGAAAEPAPVLEIGEAAAAFQAMQASPYAAGKWGRFLRAPDLYFRLLKRCSGRFVRLGEVADVRFGIKSGCDDFFMPRDVTARTLEKAPNDLAWNEVGLITPCKRREVAKGKLRIIEAGDGTLHPVEAEYLRPEVHSLMQVDRPVVRAADTDRVVLWVDKPLDELGSCFAAKYIRWGAKQTFASKKSKPVPLPQRATCAARKLWYDVTMAETGFSFWPMAQKYRHIVPANPEKLCCNHNLFYLRGINLPPWQEKALSAILNSTFVALIKHFYGRYAGAEGTLKTEVVDTTLLEIPNPLAASPLLADKMADMLERMSRRNVSHLITKTMQECHTLEHLREILARPMELPAELLCEDRIELDNCVLELLGFTDATERDAVRNELYWETTAYYQYQRTQDIQSSMNRSKAGRRGMEPADLAASVWDALRAEHADLEPVLPWLVRNFSASQPCHIPEGHAKAVGAGDMFNANAVLFKSATGSRQLDCANPEQAALVAQLAACGVRGDLRLPADPRACTLAATALEQRLAQFRKRFTELAASRAGDQALREKIIQTLVQWLTHGRG